MHLREGRRTLHTRAALLMNIPLRRWLSEAQTDPHDRLVRWLGVGGIVLIAVTWKLWTPQDVFPQIPLLPFSPPLAFDWVSLAGLMIGQLAFLLCGASSTTRSWSGIVALCWGLQFLGDQHRLQPWAWQFFLLAVVLALSDAQRLLGSWRWLVISIYVYSAASKFDAAFVDQALGYLRQASAAPTWGAASTESPPWPWLIPSYELAVAALLVSPATRRAGLYAAAVMHVSLLALLGPWGLGHSWGVLLWNVFFLVQNVWLFGARSPASVMPVTRSRFPWATRIVISCACLWPSAYPWGLCDAWLAWAVYAPSFRSVEITLGPSPTATSSDAVSLGRWSLETLGVPTYPSARFSVGVARWLAETQPREVTVFERIRPSRWQRDWNLRSMSSGQTEIEALGRSFLFNSQPRGVKTESPAPDLRPTVTEPSLGD